MWHFISNSPLDDPVSRVRECSAMNPLEPLSDDKHVRDPPPFTTHAKTTSNIDNDDNDTGGFAWRATKQLLSVDDGGASTGSEAESSHQGWSDNGWLDCPFSSNPAVTSITKTTCADSDLF